MGDDCERCAQEAQMNEIGQSIENQKTSCSRCSTKPSERNKELSKEEMNKILEELEGQDYKIWYQTIAGWSKQLRDALLSSDSFVSKMLELHKELKHLDIKKDNGQVVSKLRDMMGLAQMVETNAQLVLKTLELLDGKIHGNG